jgi:hypothetical protein
MATTLDDKMRALDAKRRQSIEARAAELIAEEMSLRDLRHSQQLTQESIAEFLGIGQDGVSRLEKRGDLLLSTLRGYVEAMGGQLRLVALFPDRSPVILTGLAAMDDGPSSSAPGRSSKKTRRTRSQAE